MAAALLLGPLSVLWRKPNPVSFDLRRDLGICAEVAVVLTELHTIAHQQIEKRLAPFQVILYIVFGVVLAFQTAAIFKAGKHG